MIKKALLVIGVLVSLNACSESPEIVHERERTIWVDSIYQSLSTRQKIAQLFMLGLTSNAQDTIVNKVKQEVLDFQVGGLCFLVGTPESQVAITNELQSKLPIPMMIALDAEWGAAMRFKQEEGFPWPMAMGALANDSLVEQVGFSIGEELKSVGVHMNFGPVADININPNNPIIGNRSFGSHLENVSNKAIAYAKGLRRAGVLSCAKHFPGHGDTDMDSHKTLPQLNFDLKRLDSIELYPYKTDLIHQVDAVMVAHLDIPAMTGQMGIPASLSKAITTDLLQDKLTFNGLVISDALNMKGITLMAKEGEAVLRAFQAGNDILLVPVDVKKGIDAIEDALKDSVVTQERLAHSVKKILAHKYDLGLNNPYKALAIDSIRMRFDQKQNHELRTTVLQDASTYVSLQKQAFEPLTQNQRIGLITFGENDATPFIDAMKNKGVVHLDDNQINTIENGAFDRLVISLHKDDSSPYKSYAFKKEEIALIERIIATDIPVYLTVFTSPYALKDLAFLKSIESVFVGYMNDENEQLHMVDLLYGHAEAKGILPISLPQLEEITKDL